MLSYLLYMKDLKLYGKNEWEMKILLTHATNF